MNRSLLILAAAALPLAACDKHEGEGSTIAINAGNAAASMDGKTGQVSIDTPLFKGSLDLPKIDLTAENFDINGVHLYPGSRIGAVNINARGDDGGAVSVKFDSPGSVDQVREWLKGQFDKAGTAVKVDGNVLSGKAEDKAFKIELTPAGDRATGTATIG